ncbi:membrane protein [Labrys miyagiensis]
MFDVLWRSVAIGIGATILMDLWAVILYKFFGQGLPNWAPVGRWFWHLQYGKVFHDDIGQAAPYEHELALGWIGHYVVGILYGILLVIVAGTSWLDAPTFIPAWIVGIVTVGAGWFLLQPGLGIGWAASKTPNPNKVRFLNLVAHTVFAIGLWGTALLIR